MNSRIHAKYFSRFLNLLPPSLSCHDSTRATIAFFAVSGIDILGSLDDLSDDAKQNIISWIYSLQVIPKGKDDSSGGFQVWHFDDFKHFRLVIDFLQGATTFNTYVDCAAGGISDYKWGHLAMTYTSIATLIILGDDLSRLDRKAIIDGKIVYLKVCAIQFMRFLYQVSLQFKGRTAALAHPSKATSTIWGSCTALAVSASCWTTGVV